MEQINKIELCGVVGRSDITPIQNTKVAHFSLATEYAYKGRDGGAIIDITWFSCTAFEGPKIAPLEKIQKGSKVHLIGRVRMQRYTDNTGCDRTNWEVICNSLDIVEG